MNKPTDTLDMRFHLSVLEASGGPSRDCSLIWDPRRSRERGTSGLPVCSSESPSPADHPLAIWARPGNREGRAQIGSTPAGGGAGSESASCELLLPPPHRRPDEGLDSDLGDEDCERSFRWKRERTSPRDPSATSAIPISPRGRRPGGRMTIGFRLATWIARPLCRIETPTRSWTCQFVQSGRPTVTVVPPVAPPSTRSVPA
jgi:hypothetical protein